MILKFLRNKGAQTNKRTANQNTHVFGKQVAKVHQGFRFKKNLFIYSPLETHSP